ncbi:MAG: ZIP family metal transporter [Paludibacter sp.]|nr:ZIP family metal transporter [Paludibacter sp.]
MSESLIFTIVALIAGSVGSVGLAGLLLLLKDSRLQDISTYLTYLAGGTLLGSAFLGMIPEAITMLDSQTIFKFILAGILFFFVLEKIILWRTCRNIDCERHIKAAAPMILVGDAFHNAIDGVVIAASFLTSIELGIFVSISIVFHEVPQELGDFGVLLKVYSKRRALLYNMLSGSSAIVAGIVAYYFMGTMKSLIPYALAFSASSFLYIALADLIPEMHQKTKLKESIIQILLIIVGVLIIYIVKQME